MAKFFLHSAHPAPEVIVQVWQAALKVTHEGRPTPPTKQELLEAAELTNELLGKILGAAPSGG